MKPYLKYPGGKWRQQELIRSRFNSRAKLYVEPFLGAGAVFFARAAADEFDRAIIADVNPRLMACHAAVRNHVEDVIVCLRNLPGTRDPEAYYDIRAMFNSQMERDGYNGPAWDAALFIWLNRACFNGLYRENAKGEFNTPVGKGPLSLPDPDHLRACSKLLQKAELITCHFGYAIGSYSNGWPDVQLYCDPPYVPAGETSTFTTYSKGGFDTKAQLNLAQVLEGEANAGVQVITSNSDTPLVRDLYAGWDIEVVRERRAINSNASKRGPVNELLISKNCAVLSAAA